MSKTSKIVIAVAAGFVAGLLFAPKSGKETRQDIKNKAFEAKKYTNKTAQQAKVAAHEAVSLSDKVRGHADRIADETRRTAGHIQKDIKKS